MLTMDYYTLIKTIICLKNHYLFNIFGLIATKESLNLLI